MSERESRPNSGGLRPILALVAICVLAGALLGAVHELTDPVIAAAAQRRERETFAALVPEAASFEAVACSVEGCTGAFYALDGSGARIGVVVVAESKGYGGEVPLAVAIDETGTVTKVTVMSNNETPGLGSRIEDESYIGQYVGLPAKETSDETIDLISGATISSKAALEAFNRAVEAYEEVR